MDLVMKSFTPISSFVVVQSISIVSLKLLEGLLK